MAEFQGKKVSLDKPTRITKKFKVYVKSGDKVKKVMFGDPNLSIKRQSDAKRKSFRARFKCSTARDKTKARYWSCKMWEKSKKVSDIV